MLLSKIESKEKRTTASGEVVPDHVFTGLCKVVALDLKNVYVQAGHTYSGDVPYVDSFSREKYKFFDRCGKEVEF